MKWKLSHPGLTGLIIMFVFGEENHVKIILIKNENFMFPSFYVMIICFKYLNPKTILSSIGKYMLKSFSSRCWNQILERFHKKCIVSSLMHPTGAEGGENPDTRLPANSFCWHGCDCFDCDCNTVKTKYLKCFFGVVCAN